LSLFDAAQYTIVVAAACASPGYAVQAAARSRLCYARNVVALSLRQRPRLSVTPFVFARSRRAPRFASPAQTRQR